MPEPHSSFDERMHNASRAETVRYGVLVWAERIAREKLWGKCME
jgi:hypothetical protein